MFEGIVKNAPFSKLAPLAQFNVGQALEKQGEYPKAIDAYQSFAQGLARLGYVTLIYDPIAKQLDDPLAAYECAPCSAKSGSPTLCDDCLRRREYFGTRWRGPRRRQAADSPGATDHAAVPARGR